MKVYLRALEIEDHILMQKWMSDPEVVKYLGGNVFFVSREREKTFIESKIADDSKSIYLGICEKETGQLIGYASINNIDLRNSKAEWGGLVIGEEKYRSSGYGKEAASKLLRFLFDQYPVHKCVAYCLAEHPVTVRLFESLGFKFDGVLRDEIFKNGEHKNVNMYSILREEINGKF